MLASPLGIFEVKNISEFVKKIHLYKNTQEFYIKKHFNKIFITYQTLPVNL